jgi:endonuclease III
MEARKDRMDAIERHYLNQARAWIAQLNREWCGANTRGCRTEGCIAAQTCTETRFGVFHQTP